MKIPFKALPTLPLPAPPNSHQIYHLSLCHPTHSFYGLFVKGVIEDTLFMVYRASPQLRIWSDAKTATEVRTHQTRFN